MSLVQMLVPPSMPESVTLPTVCWVPRSVTRSVLTYSAWSPPTIVALIVSSPTSTDTGLAPELR